MGEIGGRVAGKSQVSRQHRVPHPSSLRCRCILGNSRPASEERAFGQTTRPHRPSWRLSALLRAKPPAPTHGQTRHGEVITNRMHPHVLPHRLPRPSGTARATVPGWVGYYGIIRKTYGQFASSRPQIRYLCGLYAMTLVFTLTPRTSTTIRKSCIAQFNVTLPTQVHPRRCSLAYRAWSYSFLRPGILGHYDPSRTPRTLTRRISPEELPVTASIGRAVSFLVPYPIPSCLFSSTRACCSGYSRLETNKQIKCRGKASSASYSPCSAIRGRTQSRPILVSL